MSTDTTEAEPKRRRARRRSYADECQAHEQHKAVQHALLAHLLGIVKQIEAVPASEQLKILAVNVIGEMIE